MTPAAGRATRASQLLRLAHQVETEYLDDRGRHQVGVMAHQRLADGRWLPTVTHEITEHDGRRTCRELVDEYVELGSVVVPLRRQVWDPEGPVPHLTIELGDHTSKRWTSSATARGLVTPVAT